MSFGQDLRQAENLKPESRAALVHAAIDRGRHACLNWDKLNTLNRKFRGALQHRLEVRVALLGRL